jgi:phospholipase C
LHRIKLLGTLGAIAIVANAPGLPATATVRSTAAAQSPALSGAALSAEISQLQSKVKYVFVLYQENRSFDSYFGTFPGANGLYSQPASQTLGYTQPLTDTNGSVTTITPFRIGPAQYAADTDDVAHTHGQIVAKMQITQNTAQMNRFAQVEEALYTVAGRKPRLAAKQMGELAMAHEDCDTVPLLWSYADKFTLFDNIFQDMTGPSTPGNLTIIAAQSGVTQFVLHPDEAYKGNGNAGPGVPVLNDADPFWGSPQDKSAHPMPVNPHDFSVTPKAKISTQVNLTFASLPLTLAGSGLPKLVQTDRSPSTDLADVHRDVTAVGASKQTAVPWGWYEEGYDREPTDSNSGPTDANGTHASYITHHNGPQYFGYIANNPSMSSNLHGLDDMFNAIDKRTLPAQGGVFYVKGGYQNIMGLKPVNPDKKVQKNFLGDDDHPGYSDAQISEALIAETINKIAASPYWSQSAIILTWDDSEGDYDHVPPPSIVTGPNSQDVSLGPRVPLLVISPYARTHYISHEQGSQSSVVKFVDTLFNLTPLAKLPDELGARVVGTQKYGLDNMGPMDALTPGIGGLLSAFDPARLAGRAAPLPASYVTVPQNLITTLPQQSGYGCKDLGIVPTDQELGINNPIPSDFNPRPLTDPSVKSKS